MFIFCLNICRAKEWDKGFFFFQFWTHLYFDPVEDRPAGSCTPSSPVWSYTPAADRDVHMSSHSGDNSIIAAQGMEEGKKRVIWGRNTLADCFHPSKQWFSTLAAHCSFQGSFRKPGDSNAPVSHSDILMWLVLRWVLAIRVLISSQGDSNV